MYEDGSRYILAYTSKDATVGGNDGEIATITLNIPETMEPGDYPIIIKNTELSKDGSSTVIEYVQSTLKVVEYKKGDANGDGKLSVSDLTSIASHLLGRAPGNFILKVADANNDGKISVSDITAIAKMLLNGSNNARVRTLFTEEVE